MMNDKLDPWHPQMMSHYLEAGCPETADERLEQLADHDHPKVRARVAENPKCQKALLIKLLDDQNCDVRCAIAGHPAQILEVYERLLKDENPTVRFAMAEDSNCPEEVLEALLYDGNPYVCDRANRTLRRLKAAGFGKSHANSAPPFRPRGVDSLLSHEISKTERRRLG